MPASSLSLRSSSALTSRPSLATHRATPSAIPGASYQSILGQVKLLNTPRTRRASLVVDVIDADGRVYYLEGVAFLGTYLSAIRVERTGYAQKEDI